MSQQETEGPQAVRTIAELCLLAGMAILLLSQVFLIFDWSRYLAAAGAIIFVFGYVFIKLIAKEGKVWSVFDLFLIVGIVLIAVGAFWNRTVFLLGGFALLAMPAIPHIIQFVKGVRSYFVKSYREISQKDRDAARNNTVANKRSTKAMSDRRG